MKKQHLIVAVFVLALVAVGYLLPKPTPSTGGLKVGFLLPQSGNASQVGEQIRKAADLANSNGSVVAVYEDTANDAQKAIGAYRKLVEIDKVDVIVVAVSGMSKAVAPLAQEYRKPTFGISTSVPVTSPGNDYFVRYFIDGLSEARSMAKTLREKGIKKIGVAVINDEYGRTMKAAFDATLDGTGIEQVTETFEKDSTDFRASAVKLAAAVPECIYFIGYSKPLALAIKQADEQGLEVPYFSTFGIEIPGTIEAAGKGADGLVYTSISFGEGITTSEKSQLFVEQFISQYQIKPSNDAAFAYDLVKFISNAENRGDIMSPRILAGKSIESQFGKISFNELLEAQVPIVYKKIHGGSIQIIGTP